MDEWQTGDLDGIDPADGIERSAGLWTPGLDPLVDPASGERSLCRTSSTGPRARLVSRARTVQSTRSSEDRV